MKDIFEKINFIQKLHAAGLLTNEQGTELLNIVANNSYTLKNPAALQPSSFDFKNDLVEKNADKVPVDEQLEAFYNSLSRKNLKNFVKSSLKQVDNFDERMFKEMVENIEKDAIAAHIKEQEHSKNLIHSNDVAKGRLTSQTQTVSNVDIKPSKIYTRKEIGAMSLDEYNSNEKEIMQQMEQGLIE